MQDYYDILFDDNLRSVCQLASKCRYIIKQLKIDPQMRSDHGRMSRLVRQATQRRVPEESLTGVEILHRVKVHAQEEVQEQE